MGEELWRWHHGQVLLHQFRQIAIRRPPELPRERVLTQPAYNYRDRFGSAPLGLAAVKRAQAEQARGAMVADARSTAGVLARHHRKPVENQVSKVGRLNAAELRAMGRATLIAGLKSQQRTLAELCAMHARNGTLDQFLKSLKHG